MDIIRKEIKGFGRQVYTGRIVDGLTAGLDRILIAFFHGMAPAGFYAIALTMSSPVSMLSRSLSVSSYKRFAHEEKLPASIMIAVLLWCTLGVLLLVLASQVLIPLLFTAKYAESLSVLPYLALGVGLSGLNQPLHAFLMARRQGRSIKVMSVTTSGLMVALNLLLIPTMGMKGAAIAMVSSYGVNILMNVYYYRSYRRSLSQDTDNVSPQRSGEK